MFRSGSAGKYMAHWLVTLMITEVGYRRLTPAVCFVHGVAGPGYRRIPEARED